jgi:hypothetical protein
MLIAGSAERWLPNMDKIIQYVDPEYTHRLSKQNDNSTSRCETSETQTIHPSTFQMDLDWDEDLYVGADIHDSDEIVVEDEPDMIRRDDTNRSSR